MSSDVDEHLNAAPVTPQTGRQRTRGFWLIGVAAVVAALLRLPFVFTGLSTDEGGYAYVVQQWSRGAAIYKDAWLDRPQGLLLTYRFLLWLNDSGWTIRLGVMAAGAIVTVALGAIGWLLVNRFVGIVAAFLYAIVGVGPHLEGMTLNGELLASVPSTISIALAVYWWRRSRPWWVLLLAGLFAGLAITMKQSGIDGIIGGFVIVALAFTWSRLLIFCAGIAVPLVACVVHGITIGWSYYWTALAGYQFSAMGGSGSNSSTRWHDFTVYADQIAWDLLLIVVVSFFGWRKLDSGGRWLVGAWLFAGFVGINLGGSYWPHYYMQPLPALVLLVACAICGVPSATWRRVLIAVVALPTLIWMVALIPLSPAARANRIPYDALAARDDRIAAYIDATTAPSDRIYVLESEAYLYFAAQRTAPYPYLWGKPIDKIADALPRLRAMLASPDRPTLVVLDTPNPATVDPSGGIATDLSRYYHVDRVVDGVTILRANG